MEKLGQLVAQDEWDLIVVDTPPSRSALDFLDAPRRLGRFLDGKLIRLLGAPARVGGRLGVRMMEAGFALFSRVLTKIVGAQTLSDISALVSSLETMFGGFRERAEQTYELLRKPGTAFVVVASPEPDALREASYFVDRLESDGMPLAGVVLNRMHAPIAKLSAARAEAAAETLERRGGSPLAAGILRVHVELTRLADGERRLGDRFRAAHPQIPVAAIPAQAVDVHDLDALRAVGVALSAETP